MKRIIMFLIIWVIISEGFVFAQEKVDSNSLWQRAVLIVDTNKDLIPGFITSRVEELDTKNNVTSYEESQMKVIPNGLGEIQSELVKVILNGKDITTKRKKEQQKNNSISIDYRNYNPFVSDVQQFLSIKLLKDEFKDNMPCFVYEFTIKKETESFSGTAWLDKDNGVPVEINYIPDPLPKYINKLLTTVRYEYSIDGLWYPKEIKMEGSGGFLFIKKNFRSSMYLSNFWKRI